MLKDLALSTVVSMSLVGRAYFILDGQNDDIREGLIGITGLRSDLDQRPRNEKIEG